MSEQECMTGLENGRESVCLLADIVQLGVPCLEDILSEKAGSELSVPVVNEDTGGLFD